MSGRGFTAPAAALWFFRATAVVSMVALASAGDNDTTPHDAGLTFPAATSPLTALVASQAGHRVRQDCIIVGETASNGESSVPNPHHQTNHSEHLV